MSAEARLKELGIVLPPVPKPVANYVPYRLVGGFLYLSGQVPRDANGNILAEKCRPRCRSTKPTSMPALSD